VNRGPDQQLAHIAARGDSFDLRDDVLDVAPVTPSERLSRERVEALRLDIRVSVRNPARASDRVAWGLQRKCVVTPRPMNQTGDTCSKPFPARVAELATQRERMPREARCLTAATLT